MPSGIINVAMRVTGLSQFRAMTRGVVSEGRRTDAALLASTKASTAARGRAERALVEMARRGTRDRVRDVLAADREIVRSSEARARAESRLDAQRARELRDRMRRERVEAGRGRPGGVRGPAIAGALGAAGSAGLSRVQALGGAMGIPTMEQMVSNAIERSLRITRLGIQGGRDAAGTDAMAAQVAEVSRRTGVSQDDLIEGLEVGQNRFSQLGMFAQHLEEIAQAAQVSGGRVQDFVGAFGEFQRQLDVDQADFRELRGSLFTAAQAGSIEAGDVAANFSGTLSSFRSLRGTSGMGAAREALGLFEAMGAGGLGPEQTRTRVEALMQSLSRRDVQGRIERGLGDRGIFDARGRMTVGFDELFERMAADEDFQGSTALGEIFGGRGESRQGAEILLGGFRDGSNPIREIIDGSADRGNTQITEGMDRLNNSAGGRALAIARTAEANFTTNGDSLISAVQGIAGPMSELQSRFPLLSEGFGMLTSAASALALAWGAKSLLGGGAAAAGGAGTGAAGGAAGGLAVPFAAAGALAMNWLFPDSAGDAGTPEQIARASGRTPLDAAASAAYNDERERLGNAFTYDSPQYREFIRSVGLGREAGATFSAEDLHAIGDKIAQATRQGVREGLATPRAGDAGGVPRR